MLDYLRFRWKLWGTERARRAAHRKYVRELAVLTAGNAGADEIDKLSIDLDYVKNCELDDEVADLRTNYLMSQARKLLLDLPNREDSEMWTDGATTRRAQLTQKGMREILSAIRAEKKVIREAGLMWVAPITSILGLLVALAAIFMR